MMLKYKILKLLHQTTEEKLKKLETDKERFKDQPLRIEIDKHGFVSINEKPLRGNAVYWGKDENRKDVYTFLYGPLKLKGSNRPVYICSQNLRISINPNELVLLGTKGPLAVDWATFGKRLNDLLEEKTQVNLVQARIEALGQRSLKKPEIPAWVGYAILAGLAIAVIYFVFINPSALAGMWKSTASVATHATKAATTLKAVK